MGQQSQSASSVSTNPTEFRASVAAAQSSATAPLRVAAYAGFAVTREYYINDAAGEVDTLALGPACATLRRSAGS
jgi:hypothetical protein